MTRKKPTKSSTNSGTAKTDRKGGSQPFDPLLDDGDFLQVPRMFLYAARYLEPGHPLANPRYRMLLLAMAARQKGNKSSRAYWESLAQDLGVNKDTVRKWAYALDEAGLLKIIRHKGPARDRMKDRPGYRNEANTFDLSPLIKFLKNNARNKRQMERNRRNRGSVDSEKPDQNGSTS